MTDWKKVNGSQAEQPAEFDETSSSSVVYQRRNIHRIEVENHDGTKVALWSGELRPDILKAWLQMVAAGKNNLRLSAYGDGKYYVPNNVADRIDSWMDGKFFLYNNEYGAKWQQIFNDMELLLKAGVKVFALDNLFSLDIDILDGDKNNKQRELILQIKEFAKHCIKKLFSYKILQNINFFNANYLLYI